MNVSELVERVEQLEQRVDHLETENDRLNRELAEERQRVSELEEKVDEKADEDTTFERFSTVMTKLDDLKGAEMYDTHEDVPQPELTWLERLEHLGRDSVPGRVRKRDIHAKILLTKIPDWGFQAQGGDVILPTAKQLRAKMARHFDSFEYSELYRACEALDERMGAKAAYIENHSKVGRHIRIPAERIDDVALDLSGIDGPPESKDKRTVLAMR